MRRKDRALEVGAQAYVTGHAVDEGIDARLRREQQARITARAAPGGEAEVDAADREPHVDPRAWDDDTGNPVTVNDPDSDTQGREGEQARDWYGDAFSEAGQDVRLDDGE
jgi:hypothetical protein